MILSRQTIARIGTLIDPMVERAVHEATGLTYGLSAAGYDVRIAQGFVIGPGKFLLGSTVERFDMPSDVIGFVHDKSTLARRGIALQNTVIEPGWRGFLTVEISNHGPEMIELVEGQPIAQIVFQWLDEATDAPYAGSYQNQPARPVSGKGDMR